MALSKVGKNQVDQSASLTVDGDLTVDTNTLYVDSTNNRVGIGTSSPATKAEIYGTAAAQNLALRVTNTAADGYSTLQLFDDQAGIYRAGSGVSAYGGASSLNILTVGGHPITLGTSNTVRLTVDATGRVTMPYQPSFRSRGSNLNYIQTTPIPFPTVLHNIGSHYNSSTYTFTAPIAGRYLFHVNLGITNGSTNAYAFPTLNVNGVGQFYTYFQIASTWYGNNHLTAILDLSVNDYVNVSFSGTATYFNGGSECQFSGHLLG